MRESAVVFPNVFHQAEKTIDGPRFLTTAVRNIVTIYIKRKNLAPLVHGGSRAKPWGGQNLNF
ncbi:hypothetical protein SA3033_06670 [Aggregatibacter actinomycetemcomitans serotype d str. SA3033]|uniref:Uncharacterized protein n=1 Tax=Aggregatibacter actinomycetemcomitans TaxID=714 RepID=A0AAC8XXD9_AGGAC|nr:hypothetical protein ACT75_03350 [Aggregatibacter actinomycetemcomitans]KND85954.1 hypothetical protein H5P1_0200735 [Aggregatibacter actinomycetemcomitans serotype a str. H5P1]KOE30264.1 hypothetical protein D17P3_0310865 [Aggregatibacter actinomycetemcomitans D17P-3]KOE64247.1 hypothetical protein SCC393_0310335 [Aggregatibacter actinomycetemcomitans serotype e str. SCC393]KOE66889.1 hypothetical protein A160_0203040 [Aggregatibacter actinomycetemcomitans serotype e str. A160]KOE69555.1 h